MKKYKHFAEGLHDGMLATELMEILQKAITADKHAYLELTVGEYDRDAQPTACIRGAREYTKAEYEEALVMEREYNRKLQERIEKIKEAKESKEREMYLILKAKYE